MDRNNDQAIKSLSAGSVCVELTGLDESFAWAWKWGLLAGSSTSWACGTVRTSALPLDSALVGPRLKFWGSVPATSCAGPSAGPLEGFANAVWFCEQEK